MIFVELTPGAWLQMKNTHENMHPVLICVPWLRLCSAFRMRAHLCSAQKDSYGFEISSIMSGHGHQAVAILNT